MTVTDCTFDGIKNESDGYRKQKIDTQRKAALASICANASTFAMQNRKHVVWADQKGQTLKEIHYSDALHYSKTNSSKTQKLQTIKNITRVLSGIMCLAVVFIVLTPLKLNVAATGLS